MRLRRNTAGREGFHCSSVYLKGLGLKRRGNLFKSCEFDMRMSRRFVFRTICPSRYTRRTIRFLLNIAKWSAYIILAVTIVFTFYFNHSATGTNPSTIVHPVYFNGSNETSPTPHNAQQQGGNELARGLNVHFWNICEFDVQNLKQSPLFPHFPDEKTFIYTAFTKEVQRADIGQRVFGFLNPQFSGKYHFAITSDDASELWLSTNEDPRNVRLIAEVHAWTIPGDYKKYPTQVSAEINLKNSQKYFIESLHKNGAGVGHVSVLWKPPGAEEFNIVTGQYLSPFCTDDNDCIGKGNFSIPSHLKQTPPQPLSEESFQYYYNTSFFDGQHLDGVLPVFPYDPSYLVGDGKVKTYEGIRIAFAHHSSVYPEDTIKIKPRTGKFESSRGERLPNSVLREEDAKMVTKQFMSDIKVQHNK